MTHSILWFFDFEDIKYITNKIGCFNVKKYPSTFN